jgi:hypothetical protein
MPIQRQYTTASAGSEGSRAAKSLFGCRESGTPGPGAPAIPGTEGQGERFCMLR